MRALVEEATRRSGVLWIAPGDGAEHPLWHVWSEGAAYVVTGGAEQPLPGVADGDRVTVVVRSRERQAGRVVEWPAAVARVHPGTPEWERVVPLLAAQRLNACDAARQPGRWARESTVLRLGLVEDDAAGG